MYTDELQPGIHAQSEHLFGLCQAGLRINERLDVNTVLYEVFKRVRIDCCNSGWDLQRVTELAC